MADETTPKDEITKKQAAIECIRRSKRGYQVALTGIIAAITLPLLYITHLYAGMTGTLAFTIYFGWQGVKLGGDRKSLENKYQIDPRARM